MGRLRSFRTYGHPLVLIGVWAALEAATLAWLALLPGDQLLAGSLRGPILVSAVLVVLVGFGSRWAWWIAIFLETTGVVVGVGLAIVGEAFGAGTGVAILSAASFWLLWSGNIELYVLESKRKRLAL